MFIFEKIGGWVRSAFVRCFHVYAISHAKSYILCLMIFRCLISLAIFGLYVSFSFFFFFFFFFPDKEAFYASIIFLSSMVFVYFEGVGTLGSGTWSHLGDSLAAHSPSCCWSSSPPFRLSFLLSLEG